MKKIPTLFERNHETDHLVRDQVAVGCEWVISGEGEATRKWDGSCCMVRVGKLYRRYEAKKGQQVLPDGFEPAQEPDDVTGNTPGWVPVTGTSEEKWHVEAWQTPFSELVVDYPDGTYELCGPKINGNPEGFERHSLIRHGHLKLSDCPRTFLGLVQYFGLHPEMEGVVWHHPDGRMCKVKKRDFYRRKRL